MNNYHLSIPEEYIIPLIISNAISVGLVLVCLKWKNIGRGLFGLIFIAASAVNISTSLTQPEIYVDVYGELAAIEWYRDFIYGAFSQSVTLFVLLIAVGQLLVGILLLTKGLWVKTGITGGIIFLLAIAPLGIGSAFPSTVLMAVALLMLSIKKHYEHSIFGVIARKKER